MPQTIAPSRRRVLACGASAFGLAVAGVPVRAAGPLSAVATTGMIADALRVIGGDAVTAQALMGSGIDPHAYRQTRSDIVALTRADVVFWNGLYLEAQMEAFLVRLQRRGSVIAVAEALPADLRIAHEDYAGRHDPHIWMVPDLWRYAVEAVRDGLMAARPDQADALMARHAAYLTQMERVGAYARDLLATVPAAARVLLTAHDAFGYFGRAYDYEVMGVQGISTESEAGLDRIRTLTNLLVERRIGAVFVESSVSDRNLRALVEGAAAQGHTVRVGGEVFSDAMGAPGTYESTYIGMIDHNATTIAGALGAKVPPRGM
ncbi:MAG: metal ABC transporter solute-binding protein, Zn/Mn family [Primorskyibacter sp.]